MFEAAVLPDDAKEELCRGLLAEFGVTHVNRRPNGELIHSCCLPLGGHKNGDRNPSASLNFRKLCYSCLGCGNSGGLLWFIALCRTGSSEDAREWLSSRTGLGQEMDVNDLLALLDQIYHPTNQRPPIPRFDERVLAPWTGWEHHHPYLTEGAPDLGVVGRGIPEQTLERFRIGYNPDRERIIIPLWWDGSLVGWQARRLLSSDHPKYLNSPDCPREQVLYNYQRTRRAVIVESPMSVLRHHHHVPDMMATLGAAVSATQMRLCEWFDDLVLWFDNATEGWAATRRMGEALSRFTQVWVVNSPWAADPGDMDDVTVDQLIDGVVPYAVWKPPVQLQPWRYSDPEVRRPGAHQPTETTGGPAGD